MGVHPRAEGIGRLAVPESGHASQLPCLVHHGGRYPQKFPEMLENGIKNPSFFHVASLISRHWGFTQTLNEIGPRDTTTPRTCGFGKNSPEQRMVDLFPPYIDSRFETDNSFGS